MNKVPFTVQEIPYRNNIALKLLYSAYLDFTCYTTEAVKEESLVTRTLAIKPEEKHNQSFVYKQRRINCHCVIDCNSVCLYKAKLMTF